MSKHFTNETRSRICVFHFDYYVFFGRQKQVAFGEKKKQAMQQGYVSDNKLNNIGSVRGSPNGTIGKFTSCIIGSRTIGGNVGTNGITNGTIGRTLSDIGLPLVPLVKS